MMRSSLKKLDDLSSLYHLSYENHDGQTFTPRSMPKWRVMEGEDYKSLRVCLSTSIDGALAAIESCNSMPFGDCLFVHVPDDISSLAGKIVIPSPEKVPDAEATGEVWAKAPVKMRCIGKIEVKDLLDESKCYMHYGQKLQVDLFKWEWIERYI